LFCELDDELPLQLYHLGVDNVQCFRYPPVEHLAKYILYYWWLDIPPGNTSLEVIPDNAIDLVMSPDIANFSVLYLPTPEKFSIPLEGPIRYVGISFRAALADRFLNVSNDVMKSCAPGVDTTESLNVQSIVSGVQKLKRPEQLADRLNALATTRLEDQPSTRKSTVKINTEKALAAMQASVGRKKMETIATRFGFSDRQFRRIMGSLFGYGPKKIQRVMRLQASLKEILTADFHTGEDGFYDQAHKIKEIRALTGLTPSEIKKMAEIYNSME